MALHFLLGTWVAGESMDHAFVIKQASNWSEYIEIIESIKKEYASYEYHQADGTVYEQPVSLIYRGQGNKEWLLETTLERKTTDKFHILRYLQSATSSVAEIESLTGKDWKVPDYHDLEAEINDRQDTFRVYLPCYDYLVYLRHHGFPSPLLDWSESPFIAAYFAFISAEKAGPAVYCYVDRTGPGRGGLGGAPMITQKGPYVKTHVRHYAQKATYTLSTKWDYGEEKHFFVPHKDVFDLKYERQDLLIKIELSYSMRKSALEHMNEYNINHFTLFQSEDSLIKSIETKKFDLK
jgi:hypothetical protein